MQSTTGKTLSAVMPAKLPDGTPVTFSTVMSLITKEQWTRVRVFNISPRQGMLQARPAVAAHIGVTPECLADYLKAEFVTRAAAGRAAASARRKAEKVRQQERDADAGLVGAMVPEMIYKNGRSVAGPVPANQTRVSLTPKGEAAASARKAKQSPAALASPVTGTVQGSRDLVIMQARDLTPDEMAKHPTGTHTGLTAEVCILLSGLKPGHARALLVADIAAAQKVRQALMGAAQTLGWKAANQGGYKTWTRPAMGGGLEIVIHRLA